MNEATSIQRTFVHGRAADLPHRAGVTLTFEQTRATNSANASLATSAMSQTNAAACPAPGLMFGSQLFAERNGPTNLRLTSAMTPAPAESAGSTANAGDDNNQQPTSAAALAPQSIPGPSNTQSLALNVAYRVIHGQLNLMNTPVNNISAMGTPPVADTRASSHSYNPASSVRSIVAGAASVLGFRLGYGSWSSPSSSSSASQPDARSSAVTPTGTSAYGITVRSSNQRQFSAYRENNDERAQLLSERELRNCEEQRMPHQFRTKAVCKLDCRHCGRVVCTRAMKAMLLADTRVELFSTDTPPLSVDLVGDDYMTRNCRCRLKDVACIGCGEVCGYHITAPCARCMDACNNGHFWMFHAESVKSSDRLDEKGNKTLLWAKLPVVEQDIDSTEVYSLMCR